MKQGWEYKKLGEVCHITMGQSPDGKSINDNEGVEFHQGKTCFGERTLGVSILFSNAPVKLAEAHSVLLCVRAPVGYPNITNRKICIGRGLCALYAKKDIDNTFLFYSLLGKQSHFEKNATGSTFKAISSKVISNTEIPLPPKSIQLAIVSELDKINELIRLKKEQLKDYDNLAQSIFYEMFGDPVENEKGWEVKKLGEVCTIERGSSPRPITAYITDSKDGINWIKIGDAQEGSKYITSTKEKIKPEGLKKSRFVHKGDFILSNSMSFGKPYILKIDGCIHDGWLVIHDNNNVFIKIYLYYLLASSIMYAKFSKLAVGGVVNNLNSSLVRKVDVSIPPLPLQHLFAQRIEQIEHQKSEVTKAITDLETLLASRMQHWFE